MYHILTTKFNLMYVLFVKCTHLQVVSSPEGSVSDTKQSHDAPDDSNSTNTPTDVTEGLSSKHSDSKEHTKVSTSTDGDDPEVRIL